MRKSIKTINRNNQMITSQPARTEHQQNWLPRFGVIMCPLLLWLSIMCFILKLNILRLIITMFERRWFGETCLFILFVHKIKLLIFLPKGCLLYGSNTWCPSFQMFLVLSACGGCQTKLICLFKFKFCNGCREGVLVCVDFFSCNLIWFLFV